MILALVAEAVAAGAREERAAEVVGIAARTLARWRTQGGGEDRRKGPATPPAHKLDEAERQRVLDTANSVAFRDLSPRQIDVKVKVDGKLKKQWDQTLGEIRKAKGRGAEAFDELWEAVARVVEHDPPLYVIGGYGSAAEFFEEVLQEKERTAQRFMRVARYATPREEARYGTTVLDAALRYIEATTGGKLSGPLPVAFERLRIPVTRGGETVRLPLEQVTHEEILAAARALASKNAAPRTSSNPQETALRKALDTDKATKSTRATVRGGVITFSAVPIDSLATFAKLLSTVKLPPAPTKSPKRSAPS